MNPFLQQGWKPKPLFGAVNDAAAPAMNAVKKSGRGGTLTSLISEGGAVGGAVAGAAAGSVVPVVGTAIGGILGAGIGAFAGRAAENKIRDNEYRVGDAAKEGVTSAVLQGPLKLLKYGKTAGTALKAGAGLEGALMSGADDAAKFSLRGLAGNKVDKMAANYATKQFGLQSGFIGNFTKKYKEDPGKLIQRYGFSTADDIEQQITKQNELFGKLVEGAGSIKKTAVKRNLEGVAMELVNQGPSAQKGIGAKLLTETQQLLDGYDDVIPAKVLNQLKGQYDSLVNYTMKQNDPATYGVNKRVADVLRETIQKASGSNQLKETGLEISKLVNLSDEAGKRAAAISSRGASPVSLRNTMGVIAGGSTTGGVLGGLPGAVAGGMATAALNSPTGRRAAFKGANKAASLIAKGTGKTTPLGMGLTAGAMQPIEGAINQPRQTGAQSLEGALTSDQFSGNANIQMSPNMSAPMMGSTNPFMEQSSQNSQQMSNPFMQQEGLQDQGPNPYNKQNLLADIQRDPQNAKEYIAYYQSLEDIFNPQMEDSGLKLGNPAIARISDFESGIQALDTLGGQIQKSGVNNPLIGSLRKLNPFDTGAQDLNSEIRTVMQLVGRALEGGVLRKEDEIKYMEMLPKIGDTDATATAKIENVRRLLTTNLSAYQQNQYNFAGKSSLEDSLLLNQQGAF